MGGRLHWGTIRRKHSQALMVKCLRLVELMLLVPILAMLLSGCVVRDKLSTLMPCYGEREWVDFLKVNDINYVRIDAVGKLASDEEIGNKVGKITYTMEDHPCTDRKTSKNGDAAYLSKGTVVYELKGYKPEFRVVADHKIYQVTNNPHAKTMGDLYDIEGKVAKISLAGGSAGTIGDFSAEATEQFVRKFLLLRYVGFDEIYQNTKPESGSSLRIWLQDGTWVNIGFHPNANAFTDGAYGTESLRTLIMSERERIKAAAGM